jgi:RNA polymerase sigma-70 factor (ECF subfamily)
MIDDNKILDELKRGNKLVLRQFYHETQSKLRKWVECRVKNNEDAEEIVQDTYLAFIDSLPLFQGKSSLNTFLVSIAKHEVYDYWRKKYAKKAILTIPFAEHLYTEKLYSSAQTALMIKAIYEKLLPQEAQILKWKYEEDFALEEIAVKLRISIKAAESRLFRARKAFQVAYLTVSSSQ